MERTTGRPRDPHIRGAVLNATVDELSQVGYTRLTLEAVARRAGTTKPSIYRRWRSRQLLVLDALAGRLGALRAPESGCVVCDLFVGINVFLEVFRRMPPGALGALLADCAGQADLREAFMSRLFEPPRQAVGELVDRAKARGELRADLDRELAVDLVGALVHYRALFGHAATDEAAVWAAVVTLLRGMAANYGELAGRQFGHGHDLG
jgi:AcrR family transcriptional regulator